MIGIIKHITDFDSPTYTRGNWSEFIAWLRSQRYLQFDVETNVTDWWDTRVLISMQFGSFGYDNRTQWFIQRSAITDEQFAQIKEVLEDRSVCKVAHNVTYEYVIMRFCGVIMENVYDTMLGEQVLKGGLESEDYSLAGISWKYMRIQMNKDEQRNFGDNIITDSKILYGITDVIYLDTIRTQQIIKAREESLLNVLGLEMEAVLAFGDITYNGMLLDKEKWRDNIRLAEPIVEAANVKLNDWLSKEPFKSYAESRGYISNVDRLVLNMSAPQQKHYALQLLFPDIPGASLPIIKKYIRDNGEKLEPHLLDILVSLQNKNAKPLGDAILSGFRNELIEKEYLIPAGKITINWNSTTHQVLPLMQLAEPRIKGLSKEERAKFNHPLLEDYAAQQAASDLTGALGEAWIEKNVGPDGYVRTKFNLVLVTGRVSSAKPNMQNIIVNELVGTRYRNAFVCEEDEEYCDSDYSSQELVLIAKVSGDPVWLDAIAKGEDLHSICAELLYGKRWKEAADAACTYYNPSWVSPDKENVIAPEAYELIGKPEGWTYFAGKQKCKCKKHKVLRNGVKTLNFGLAYGMSEIKLSGSLKISRQEALKLMEDYFNAFPLIKRTLTFLGNFGVEHGYIMTLAPFNRKRYFPYWREWSAYADVHTQGIKFIPALGEIERASKNQPIQGSAADITKCAMVFIREYIRDHDLWNVVKLRAQVHDQVTTTVKKYFAQEWKPILHRLMLEGGKVVVPSGILGADTQLTGSCWTK